VFVRSKLFVLILGLAIALVMNSCSKKGSGGDDVDDGNDPFLILDLRVAAVTDSSVLVTWTATGDDADQGTCAQYDLRYYRSMIRYENWDSCTAVTGEPAPRVAGSADSMEIRGLEADSTYYFALKACDEASNCAGPSNCVTAVCFNDAPIFFADDSLEVLVRDLVNKPTGQLTRLDVAQLKFIDGNNRGITNLEGIGQLWEVEVAFMSGNDFSDLTPLTDLPKLRMLHINGCGITNIEPIAVMDQLQILFLDVNLIADISPIAEMSGLHILSLRQCSLTDLAPLVANPDIADADTVIVTENFLSETAVNVQIPALEARGVTVFR
jgi:hypothetical protein